MKKLNLKNILLIIALISLIFKVTIVYIKYCSYLDKLIYCRKMENFYNYCYETGQGEYERYLEENQSDLREAISDAEVGMEYNKKMANYYMNLQVKYLDALRRPWASIAPDGEPPDRPGVGKGVRSR